MPPTAIITPLQKSTAKAAIVGELGLTKNTPERDLLFELVRAIAWASTQGRYPVDEPALLDRATTAALAYLRKGAVRVRSDVTGAVDALEALGDLTRLPRGRWICTPAHLVDTRGRSAPLLICGLPSGALPAAIRNHTRVRGAARYVANNVTPDLPTISMETWQRKPDEPLPEWSDHLLRGQPLDSPDAELVATGTYTFYLPGRVKPAAPQRSRWRPTDTGLSGRQLARIRSITGTLTYRIVQMKNGAVVGAKEIDHDTARRLMYGIDLGCRRPTEAFRKHEKGHVTISTANPLPHSEVRSLSANAIAIDGARWILPKAYAGGCPELTNLGVKLADWR